MHFYAERQKMVLRLDRDDAPLDQILRFVEKKLEDALNRTVSRSEIASYHDSFILGEVDENLPIAFFQAMTTYDAYLGRLEQKRKKTISKWGIEKLCVPYEHIYFREYQSISCFA